MFTPIESEHIICNEKTAGKKNWTTIKQKQLEKLQLVINQHFKIFIAISYINDTISLQTLKFKENSCKKRKNKKSSIYRVDKKTKYLYKIYKTSGQSHVFLSF